MNELSVLIRAINHNNRKIQPPSLPSELEEAADCYKDTIKPEDVDDYVNGVFYEAFTEYQIADAFIAVAKWQKEQMMCEAIEATIDNTAYPTRLWFNTYLSEYSNNDKVRIIIVKED